MVVRAHFGPIPVHRPRSVLTSLSFAGCASMGRSIFPTCARRTISQQLGSIGGFRTFLVAPLRLKGEFVGRLGARRMEVRPFTPVQIKLLETFADQAVIAIENVRLFNELKESLEQQTATSEILGVIASSPTDIQPVLDAVAENAARLCGADDATISASTVTILRLAAHTDPSARRSRCDPSIATGDRSGRLRPKNSCIFMTSPPNSKQSSRKTRDYERSAIGLFLARRYCEKACLLV